MKVLSCDPGLTGGLALIGSDGLMVERMPILKASGGKDTLDLAEVDRLVTAWAPDHIIIEKQMVLPKQGSVSGFRTGLHFGMLVGFVQAKQIPLTLVAPATWKKAVGVSADKESSRLRANQLFPKNAGDWKLKRDEGLCEAALIGYWFLNHHLGPKI